MLTKIWGKNLCSEYNQKLLDHAKQSATDALKTASKSAFQKIAEIIGDFIGNKVTDKVTSLKNFTTEYFWDTRKWNRKYRISLRNIERKIHIYRKKSEYYWWSRINIIV